MLYSWGFGYHNDAKESTPSSRLHPKQIDLDGERVKEIYGGINSVAIVTDERQLLTWGKNECDVLGHLKHGNVAANIIETPQDIHDISIGMNHMIIVGSKETKKIKVTEPRPDTSAQFGDIFSEVDTVTKPVEPEVQQIELMQEPEAIQQTSSEDTTVKLEGDESDIIAESPAEYMQHEADTVAESPAESQQKEADTVVESPTESQQKEADTVAESSTEFMQHEADIVAESPSESQQNEAISKDSVSMEQAEVTDEITVTDNDQTEVARDSTEHPQPDYNEQFKYLEQVSNKVQSYIDEEQPDQPPSGYTIHGDPRPYNPTHRPPSQYPGPRSTRPPRFARPRLDQPAAGYQGKNFDPNFRPGMRPTRHSAPRSTRPRLRGPRPDASSPVAGYQGKNFDPDYRPRFSPRANTRAPYRQPAPTGYQGNAFNPNYRPRSVRPSSGYQGSNFDPNFAPRPRVRPPVY